MLKLGVDIIKIDKMFVDAFGTDRNSTTTVETLVDLARTMLVVSEGVENFEQVVHLHALGVRSEQDYVFAPPQPVSSFLKLIEALVSLQAGSIRTTAWRRRRDFSSPNEKGRPCGRPVKTPRGRNLVRAGLLQAGPRDRI